MTDILIIGGGPAGASAALYTARAGLSTRLIYKDHGALTKAERVENFYGQASPPNGLSLVQTGLEQIRQVGAEVIQAEVVGLSLDDYFSVKTGDGTEYKSKAVILATGASREAPSIPGLREYEGRGVSYCAVCDAFFYRDKDVIVLGSGAYAAQEAKELEPVVKSVTLLNPDEVIEIIGDKTVTGVRLTGGEEKPVSGVFVAIGIAGGTDLAKKIGAVVDTQGIAVDARLCASIPGLWAAGDCTPGMKQIAKAVYDGALAGAEAAKYVKELKVES